MEAVTLMKYPRPPHLEGSRLQPGDEDLFQVPFLLKHLVVEEKIDGSNSGISFDENGNFLLQSRWRNRNQKAAVPEVNLEKMLSILEPPSPREARNVEWITTG
ncbi:MAG: hypothetical protein ACI3XG_02685 [Faecousia sp.]